jgi:peptidoglycan hydrolase-like protein with peptidoglycan-binding domain
MRYDSRDDELTFLSCVRGVANFFGETIVANPGVAGGATALCVAMSFFTANAVFFQQQPHPSAFFATRPELLQQTAQRQPAAEPSKEVELTAAEPNVTRFVIQSPETHDGKHDLAASPIPLPERKPAVMTVNYKPEAPEIAEGGDRTVAGIQELLAKLGYYDGAVDGLKGPKTNAAVDAYKGKAGLRDIELTDAELITSMRNNLDVTAAVPAPRPDTWKSADNATVASLIDNSDTGEAIPVPAKIPSAEVVKVQAALKAFGNTSVVVDGLAGGQTETAIREFQGLFRLPVTGEIDGPLLDKMRDVGLIQ